jgi:hypothetical protein
MNPFIELANQRDNDAIGPSAGDMAIVHRWRGGINDKFRNIESLHNILTQKKADWNIPDSLIEAITSFRNELQTLIPLCRGPENSLIYRGRRNTLLAEAVRFCRQDVKAWAISQHAAGVLHADEVHTLGFLLPGDIGGHRQRAKATTAIAEVKVQVLSADNIRVIIDRAAEENAGAVSRSWPEGVRQALISIIDVDGNKEIYHRLTSRLHTTISMPAGSHGKQFAIKAAFLRHIDDSPTFGPAPTFSMPLTTEDLITRVNRQHPDADARAHEIELHRREITRLEAEIAAAKNP